MNVSNAMKADAERLLRQFEEAGGVFDPDQGWRIERYRRRLSCLGSCSRSSPAPLRA
jgi:hypothetical protein